MCHATELRLGLDCLDGHTRLDGVCHALYGNPGGGRAGARKSMKKRTTGTRVLMQRHRLDFISIRDYESSAAFTMYGPSRVGVEVKAQTIRVHVNR
jgi:hypothetical protein